MGDFLIQALGFLGGAIGTIQAFPQAWRIRKLGHGFGVSVTSWILMYARSAAWLGYSFAALLLPLILSNVLATVAAALVVVALMAHSLKNWLLLVGGGSAIALAFALLPMEFTNPILLFITLFVRVPQLRKTWQLRRSGRVSAMSMGSLALSLASLLSWEIYFIALNQSFLILTTSIALVFTLAISAIEYYAMRLTKNAVRKPSKFNRSHAKEKS